MQDQQRFDSWAIVEIMGHSKLAGPVTEQAIGGNSFVRVDVPERKGYPAFTKLFGSSAIFSITPVSEDLARKAAKYCDSEPVSVYIPPDQKQLKPGNGDSCEHGLHFCEVCEAREEEDDDLDGGEAEF